MKDEHRLHATARYVALWIVWKKFDLVFLASRVRLRPVFGIVLFEEVAACDTATQGLVRGIARGSTTSPRYDQRWLCPSLTMTRQLCASVATSARYLIARVLRTQALTTTIIIALLERALN